MEKLKVENLTEKELEEKMYKEIKELIENSRRRVLRFANTELVNLYWYIGENIVNNLQKGEKRAKYGDKTIDNIAIKLTYEYGKNFSARNLWNMRKFYLLYPILQTLSAELSWSHYLELLKVKEEPIRNFICKNVLIVDGK